MQIVLVFANGDETTEEIAAGQPPGRLSWQDEQGPQRELWLDIETWAREGRAEYREVARRR